MGGLGSGRQPGFGRMTVEDYRTIDVNYLHRNGLLAIGSSFRLRWQRDSEQVSVVAVRAEPGCITLTYEVSSPDRQPRHMSQHVPIIMSPCTLGGQRPYFRCHGRRAGITCGRCVEKLHGPAPYFRCRICADLPYMSQRENELHRLRRRAEKLRRRLGDDPTDPACQLFLPRRPRGMWHSKFNRMSFELLLAEVKAGEVYMATMRRLLPNDVTSA